MAGSQSYLGLDVEPIDHALRSTSASLSELQKSAGLQWEASKAYDVERISFLDLPLELREKIYAKALVREELICNPSKIVTAERYVSRSNRRRDENQPNLALFGICRQIRAEAQKIYYGSNTFSTLNMAALESYNAYTMMVPAPFNSLLRRVQYCFLSSHAYYCSGAFPHYLNKVREWVPTKAHVELRFAHPQPHLIKPTTNEPRELSLQYTVDLLKKVTGWSTIPERAGLSIDGTELENDHFRAALALWHTQAEGTTWGS